MDERPEISRDEAVALVTQIARQRRKEAEPRFEQEPPAFVMDILSSEVTYTLHPRALPFSLADFRVFRSILDQEYKLQFEVPSQLPELMKLARPRVGAEAALGGPAQIALDLDEVGQYLFRLPEPIAQFTRGRLEISKRSLVEIQEVILTRESIFVKIRGVTDVAELLIKDLVQYLWASAEADRSWEEIEKLLQKKTFGTSTRVRLGFSPKDLLSSRLTRFVETDVVGGQRLGRLMGSRSDRDHFESPSESKESWYVDELHVKVSRFDATSLENETHRVRIGVGRRDYQGTDVVDVDSVLTFEEHCRFVDALIRSLTSSSGQET